MENVPRLLSFRGGKVFETFVATLRAADYHVAWDVLYGPDFGLAQTRSRLVLLASRLGPVAMPVPTHDAQSHRTVRDEIGELPPLGHGEIDDCDPLHRTSRLSETNCQKDRLGQTRGALGVIGTPIWSHPATRSKQERGTPRSMAA